MNQNADERETGQVERSCEKFSAGGAKTVCMSVMWSERWGPRGRKERMRRNREARK